ncbi:MAG: hypothetical protein NTY30_03705, partial [Candidatus Berkelbacteria bacterium]|nr:hypothetical protein [Candidatus Berkelbacteria bacterium]
ADQVREEAQKITDLVGGHGTKEDIEVAEGAVEKKANLQQFTDKIRALYIKVFIPVTTEYLHGIPNDYNPEKLSVNEKAEGVEDLTFRTIEIDHHNNDLILNVNIGYRSPGHAWSEEEYGSLTLTITLSFLPDGKISRVITKRWAAELNDDYLLMDCTPAVGEEDTPASVILKIVNQVAQLNLEELLGSSDNETEREILERQGVFSQTSLDALPETREQEKIDLLNKIEKDKQFLQVSDHIFELLKHFEADSSPFTTNVALLGMVMEVLKAAFCLDLDKLDLALQPEPISNFYHENQYFQGWVKTIKDDIINLADPKFDINLTKKREMLSARMEELANN